MYTAPKLVELLEQQHHNRKQPGLFKKGTFHIQWRAKVGSFPHPDGETIVSAGEPCGAWQPSTGRPEDKRNVAENWERLYELPLNGYIPGSSVRGLVRHWANQNPAIAPRMRELLGYQDTHKNEIYPGKIEFLDAYPSEPQKLTLDIVNPQQEFQVFHRGQSTPLSFYTLGNGDNPIPVTFAIRGTSPHKVTPAEVEEVWGWVEQALSFYGVGSRTASGYGALSKKGVTATPPGIYRSKTFTFALYSQGCYGANQSQGYEELRPSHWRGWLRSWLLRFLLGVMTETDAQATLGELLGTIEPEAKKGCVRLTMTKSNTWGEASDNDPAFYLWRGKLEISAPSDILNKIILPVIKIAASVGGVGRGWRRPLHIFRTDRGYEAARGSYLKLSHRVTDKKTEKDKIKNFGLHPNKSETWQSSYDEWLDAVRAKWPTRIGIGANNRLEAEVFSPETCAVYTVAAPAQEPVNFKEIAWEHTHPEDGRGDGLNLIYQQTSPRNYKRNPDLGGDAGRGSAHCSWVSIRRVNIRNTEEDTDCQETVCLFLGGVNPTVNKNHIRSRFLQDISACSGSTYLFGVIP